MNRILFFVALTTFLSCGTPKTQESQTDSQSDIAMQTDQNKENSESLKNTMVVNENKVIFFFPDSIESAEMQSKYDEDTYNEIVADMTWYPGIAGETLDTLGIKYIHCDKEFLILVKSDKTETKLKRKEVDGNMILFNVEKDPIISTAIEFDREVIIDYFDIK
ncbi:MAG: hypothetical protein A2041_13470 [Bacteroidetes bacterium GWA2_31_9b]|nr:MAG: hypothetical protein A2041_13470 [Bacteroidetes bacterium GWA2_31_9b]